jgi:hypothetical protein
MELALLDFNKVSFAFSASYVPAPGTPMLAFEVYCLFYRPMVTPRGETLPTLHLDCSGLYWPGPGASQLDLRWGPSTKALVRK